MKGTGPRHASTYRGARRNKCRRQHGIWAQGHYYSNRFNPEAMKDSHYVLGGKSFGGWGGMRNFFFPTSPTATAPRAMVTNTPSRARAAGRGT